LPAHLAGEECVEAAGKINLTFAVAGPLFPVPLERGNPQFIK
jgi:hypothetical protein